MVLGSGWVAVTVYTVDVVFSIVLAVSPEDIIGISLASVTVIATALVRDVVPSETCTTISYTLFAPLSIGASKFGETLKLTFPDASILHNEASRPEIE